MTDVAEQEPASEVRVEEQWGQRQTTASYGSFLVYDDSRGVTGVPIAAFRDERDALLFRTAGELVKIAQEVAAGGKLDRLKKWAWWARTGEEKPEVLEVYQGPTAARLQAAARLLERVASDLQAGFRLKKSHQSRLGEATRRALHLLK